LCICCDWGNRVGKEGEKCVSRRGNKKIERFFYARYLYTYFMLVGVGWKGRDRGGERKGGLRRGFAGICGMKCDVMKSFFVWFWIGGVEVVWGSAGNDRGNGGVLKWD
jgi:hypothetical protein